MEMHKLVIEPHSARTECGIEISAYYPGSNRALPVEANVQSLLCTTEGADVTCEKCLEKK